MISIRSISQYLILTLTLIAVPALYAKATLQRYQAILPTQFSLKRKNTYQPSRASQRILISKEVSLDNYCFSNKLSSTLNQAQHGKRVLLSLIFYDCFI
ncbi:hypothetical protein PVA45_08230 (plasmid) [Entomospira entomophila]|uniref:Uncharacterized protein n=1 Tax=Entomospira entomophila TaxID=2719988 RepID=A0A968GAA1_9SPIO|nr:hypothetical protein [Entomospira entomophilus]NIZ41493.1 hypothetical protein [Entomospira entomophilus]WDI36327.1 hypothetical protein PVA45_08230 [Entomospira entomophilus]